MAEDATLQHHSEEEEEREQWNSNTAFLFASIGAAVGLGTVVRFPFLAYKHGGAAFLIPYVFGALFVGVPLLGLELMLGQKMQRGEVESLAVIHPRAWGIGAVGILGGILILMYYNVIMGWTWIYFFNSFKSPLPWADNVGSELEDLEFASDFYSRSLGQTNTTCWQPGLIESLDCGLGAPHWPLVLGLGIQYFLVFVCNFGGVDLIGKVVMVVMPMPFVMLGIIAIYGATLQGAGDGVKAYILDPQPSALAGGEVWVDAIGQIFFGLGTGMGGMVAYASNQPSDAKVVKNTWIIVIVNSIASIFCGFVVFIVVGHLAWEQTQQLGVPVEVDDFQDALAGYQLGFVTFPVALSKMPGSNFFAVVFFITLLLLGLDSAMNLAEAVVCTLKDNYPWCRKNTAATTGMVCLVGFTTGLVMCTPGGEIVIDIVDHFTSTYCLLVIGVLECVMVGWVYDLYPTPYVPKAQRRPLLDDMGQVEQGPVDSTGGSAGAATASVAGSAADASSSSSYAELGGEKTRTWVQFLTTSRLAEEMETLTGEKAMWLPVLWPVMIKIVTPSIVFGLFAFNVYKDLSEPYGGYPVWANAVFGWLLCVVTPIGFMVAGAMQPMDMTAQRKLAQGSSITGIQLSGDLQVSGNLRGGVGNSGFLQGSADTTINALHPSSSGKKPPKPKASLGAPLLDLDAGDSQAATL